MEEDHLDQDLLKQNLELAIDVYLDGVNLCGQWMKVAKCHFGYFQGRN